MSIGQRTIIHKLQYLTFQVTGIELGVRDRSQGLGSGLK